MTLPFAHGIQPGPVFVIVGSVDHHQVFFFAAVVHQGVIDHIGIGIEELGVAGFAHRQRSDIVAANAVQEGRTAFGPSAW